MKKKKIVILFFVFILIGGVYLKKEADKKKLLETEGPRIEKYLKHNYENYESITFETVVVSPTGTPHIKGYVNNDPELKFDIGISRDHFNAGLNWDDDNKSLTKKEAYKYQSKTVEEIEKEEASQKNK
ncbi:DUF1433 domain-containing protein [Isobaculum melis]|uniref:DUF1433 domain-containing protein n=1 Tax=Isobaculum melis TaxID=142588 RepID=A0A1H9TZR8_9LACT|nr:DUF1433 domain-containing protein [Isobaculum melis]SES02686.1 Protein of unknown function [Isobaculum melis]